MICEVIVDIASSPVDKIFDYSFNQSLNLKIGQRVLVPFGNRQIEGYVLCFKENSNLDSSKLKNVIKSLDDFSYLNEETINLMHFMIKKYNLRYADCLRLFVPNVVRNNVKEKYTKFAKLSKNFENDFDTNLAEDFEKNSKICQEKCKKNEENLQKNGKKMAKKQPKINEKQAKILAFLKQNKQFKLSELNVLFSSQSIKTLIKNGYIEIFEVLEKRNPYSFLSACENKVDISLTPAQQNAVSTIKNKSPNTFLLFGVTASGKTEVYIKVIENCLKQGKTALLLVPEIGLTPQLFKRFTTVFGDNVAIIHSGLTKGEKLDEWLKIKRGEAKVVIGARSAIFAPLENIGIIIIDEEHDTSYYSETNPRYYAKDVAEFRAKFNNASLVLGSATPSIETYYLAKQSKIELIEMKQRAVAKKLPEIFIVDMMKELRMGNCSMFSKLLQLKLKECMDKNQQALIFLNRRGYTSFLRCLDCGYVPKCEDCDVSLVYHKEDEKLKCHYCGNRYKVLTKCPQCGSTNIRLGAVGTQQVVEKLEQLFPNVKIFRMDNDSTSTKDSATNIIEQFNNTMPAILVGTQMISKGHNFNGVSLVGIIDADLSLHYADFRSTDRTFNLLTQVAGRAGRTNLEGEVVLQTYMPRHFAYACVCSNNYEKFFEKEINLRKVTKFPPFSKIVRVLASSENDDEVKDFIQKFYQKVVDIKNENLSAFVYVGAMKSPVKRAKKQFRYQILMRLNNDFADDIISKLFEINKQLFNKDVTSFVEIDPQNLS